MGVPVDEAVAQVGAVVEGLNALPAVVELARHCGVEMPICEMVDMVVFREDRARGGDRPAAGSRAWPEGPAAYDVSVPVHFDRTV